MAICIFVRANDHGIVLPRHYASPAPNPKERLADEVSNLPPDGKHQHRNESREEGRDPNGVTTERTERSHLDDPDIFRRSRADIGEAHVVGQRKQLTVRNQWLMAICEERIV